MRTPFLIALGLWLAVACTNATEVGSPAARLETTPRHHEWAAIPSAGRTLHAYLAYPERADRAPAVLVIHENRGLTDWVRSVADQLAERGYLAIAPDMLSGDAPGGGRTSDLASEDAAREAISRLQPARVREDLRRAADYVRSLPSASGTLYVAGFCWGGARTWEVANDYDPIAGAFVFYGTGPREASGIAGIDAPVYGLYGGNDARVNATIDASARLMREAGKTFDPVVYDGAGHAFMRIGEQPDASEANRRARDQAWSRWLALMR
ncbi:MAG TPA: dienelactone hydrolase family protein [Thermoanaerobaculia bacterium]|nr:dienelactone hydrolase family protein [Thermoanaerobaculia bacterium]